MTFANPLPWWLFLPVLALAGFLAFRAYGPLVGRIPDRFRHLLVGVRFVILTALLVFLMRPVVVLPSDGLRDGIVAVLVDASRSMRIADVDGESRVDRATRLVHEEVVPGLSGRFTVERFSFGDQLTPHDLTGLDASDGRSDLVGALEALRHRYTDRTLAGVILLSDGGDTGERDVAAALQHAVAPVYTIAIGDPAVTLDREVVSVTAGAAALQDAVVRLDATVVSHGFEGAPFEVRVLENGRPIHVRRATPGAEASPIHEAFQVSPARDVATMYTVEVPVDSRERVQENNARSLLVQPPGRPRRVLVVQGAPGYEHSFMMRALGDDIGLTVDAVVRKGNNDDGEPTFYVQAAPERAAHLGAGFPDSRRALFVYDALALANVESDELRRDQLAWIHDFVARRGGGLVMFGAGSFRGPGWSGTPLEAVVPLDPTRRWDGRDVEGGADAYRLVLTPEGERHPILQLGPSVASARERWAAMPSFGGSLELGGPRAGASVLAVSRGAGGAQHPLLAVQPYGLGRAMVMAGEGTWRWRMLTPSTDRTFETFWQQVVRWLGTAAPTAVTVTLGGGEAVGSPVVADVQVRDDDFEPVTDAVVRVTLTGPGRDRESRMAELVDPGHGRYRVSLRADQAGVYRADVAVARADQSLEAPDAWVLVGGGDPELMDPRRNDDVLRRISAATGGRLVAMDEVDTLAEAFEHGQAGDTPPRYRDLWHSVWSFILVVGMLTGEWVGRRRLGLR